MAEAVILRRGIASGNRVAVHMIVNKYWLSDLVRGRGPRQSIKIRSKGSPMAGIGCKGAGRIFWLGLPIVCTHNMFYNAQQHQISHQAKRNVSALSKVKSFLNPHMTSKTMIMSQRQDILTIDTWHYHLKHTTPIIMTQYTIHIPQLSP